MSRSASKIKAFEQHRVGRRAFALLLVLIGLLLGLLLALARPAAAGEALVLREQIEVAGELVTIGDLFENAGDSAGIAVFRSPDIGTEGVVAASRVSAAVRQYGLAWPNPGEVDKVVVKRPSRHVPLEAIAELITNKLAADLGHASADSFAIEFHRSMKPMDLDLRVEEPLIVKRLDHNAVSGNFRAVIGLDARADFKDHIYTGKAIETVPVALPAHDIGRGQIITESDLMEARLPRSKLLGTHLSDKGDLVGMVAKQSLVAGRPVQSAHVERAKLVRKNELVTIVYSIPGMVLKTQGRAQADAEQGDMVAVLNMQSKRIVHATATATGIVEVAPTSRSDTRLSAAPSADTVNRNE